MKVFKNLGIIFFLPTLVLYLFLPLTPAHAFGKKSDICGSWNNYCKKPTKTKTYTPRPTGPTAKERQDNWNKQDLQDASLDAYDTGVEFFEKKDWGAAIMHFERALEYDPENYDALDDLDVAKKKLHDANLRKIEDNKAFQEAAAAAEHAKKLDYKESQKIFDRRGGKAQSSTTAVDARGYKQILGKKVDVPKEHKNNPKIIKMQNERKVLEKKFKKLEKSLIAVKKKRVEGKGDKGKLQVEEVKIKMQMDNVKQNTQAIDVKMESFVISLNKKKTPAKK